MRVGRKSGGSEKLCSCSSGEDVGVRLNSRVQETLGNNPAKRDL